MSEPYCLVMTNTQTTFHKPYFVSRFDSEVLEFAAFTPNIEDTDQGDLIIGFRSSRAYYYPMVSAGTYIGLILAESAGKYFNANIRNLPNFEASEALFGSTKNLVDVLLAPLVVTA